MTGGACEAVEPEPSAADDAGPQPGAASVPLDLACEMLPEAAQSGWIRGTAGTPFDGAPLADVRAVGDASWDVALRVLQSEVGGPTRAFSPLSLLVSMGLSYGRYGSGACGDELLAAMRIDGLEGLPLHDAIGSTLARVQANELAGVQQEGTILDPVELSFAPSIWEVTGPVEAPGYTSSYGAALHAFDGGEVAAMNAVINCTIEEDSQGLLPDFLPASLPANDTTAIDLAVSHLRAPWSAALQERGPLAFVSDDGAEFDVPSIGAEEVSGGWLESEFATVASLPLRGDAMEVMFVMPTGGTLEAYLGDLTTEGLLELREEMGRASFSVRMPSLDIDASTEDYVNTLGIACEPFTLRSLLHGAALTLDEKGVEAAAGAAAEQWQTGGAFPEFYLELDRPFAFFVFDTETGAVLYSGSFGG
ncbi:MAG: serpin family protein [Myxococcota bacterium]